MTGTERVRRTIFGQSTDRQPIYGWVSRIYFPVSLCLKRIFANLKFMVLFMCILVFYIVSYFHIDWPVPKTQTLIPLQPNSCFSPNTGSVLILMSC